MEQVQQDRGQVLEKVLEMEEDRGPVLVPEKVRGKTVREVMQKNRFPIRN
jgi:hypothetical protein